MAYVHAVCTYAQLGDRRGCSMQRGASIPDPQKGEVGRENDRFIISWHESSPRWRRGGDLGDSLVSIRFGNTGVGRE